MRAITTRVIIPALDEEKAIGLVIASIPAGLVEEIIVVDNGSADRTAVVAERAGARVIQEPARGYGAACLAGIRAAGAVDILVFMDGDFSDYGEDMPLLLHPIVQDCADLVIGSRLLGKREPGAIPPHALFGNYLASRLLRLLFGQKVTDLGPFRAIRRRALEELGMTDRGYGWTVEMQARAARRGLRVVEVPVRYRRRLGKSKITGSLTASLKAGATILWVLFREFLAGR